MIRRLAAWWLRTVSRHFCFACDRLTVLVHQHSDRELARWLEDVSPWT